MVTKIINKFNSSKKNAHATLVHANNFPAFLLGESLQL
jgi:hypothetical protein